MISVKRIYEPYSIEDGYRVLVDRLWPRGIKKDNAHIDLWLKDISPSHELRKWFNHEADKWEELLERYTKEIDQSKLEKLKQLEEQHGIITLVYAAKNEKYNNAVAILSFMDQSEF